jgi:hypothetical protein
MARLTGQAYSPSEFLDRLGLYGTGVGAGAGLLLSNDPNQQRIQRMRMLAEAIRKQVNGD